MEDKAPVVGGNPAAASGGSRGTSQTGVRLYNERLILSLIRRHPGLAKVEIARLTGLSTQTTTVIINRLEADGLLVAGEPQRGRIGQPSVPYTLNPDGAFGLGLMIGRRSSDLVLMDFTAGIRARRRMIYAFPLPQDILAFAEREMPHLLAELPEAQHARISGLGVAMPFDLWNWEADLKTPPGALGPWRDFDVAAELARRFPRLAGPPLQRRDVGLRGRTHLRHWRGLSRFRLFLRRHVHRRRHRSQRQSVPRPQRQCRCARLDADHAA